jgi:predicted alpha/beta-hydrolase family hydrolase
MANLATPTLILQEARNGLGNADEVVGYALSGAVRIH